MNDLIIGEKITIVRFEQPTWNHKQGRLRFLLARVTAVEIDDAASQPITIIHYKVNHQLADHSLAGELLLTDEGHTWIRGWNQNEWPALRAVYNLG